MQWSVFTHAFPSVGILWHAVRLEAVGVKKEILNQFSPAGLIFPEMIGPEVFNHLVAKGFIILDSNQDELNCAGIKDEIQGGHNIQAMYLILTTACNLRCSYCLYGSPKSGSLSGSVRYMNTKVAFKAIDLFARETKENNRCRPDYWEQITFYGGEPLLNLACTPKFRHIIPHNAVMV